MRDSSDSISSSVPSITTARRDLIWYAVTTRSRHERSVARFLTTNGLTAYVPEIHVWSRRTDRRKRIEVPALPGYLFLRCVMTPENRALIKKAPGVVGLLAEGARPIPIPQQEIESLRIVLAARTDVFPETEWKVGQPVQVINGPLKGARGTLIRTQPNQHRLFVRVEYVGLALSVSIHASDVAMAGAPR